MNKRILNLKALLSVIMSMMITVNMVASMCAVDSLSDSQLSEIEISDETQYHELTLDNLSDELVLSAGLNIREVGKRAVSLDLSDAEELSSFTTINEDGTRTLNIFSEPIKYVDRETGDIKFIDNKLENPIISSRISNDVAYYSSGNSFDITFPKQIDSGITVSDGYYSVKMTPVVESTLSTQAIQSKDLLKSKKLSSAAKTANDEVEYANVFGNNTVLQYSATNSGIKETIILDEFTGQNEFQFILNVDGGIAECDGYTVNFYNIENDYNYCQGEFDEYEDIEYDTDFETKELVGSIAASWAMDSSDNAYPVYGSYDMEELGGGKYLLTMIIPKEFLESSDTVYPVVIDPTVSLGYSSMQNTTVYSGQPNTSYYTNNWLAVGTLGVPTNSTNNLGEAISYVRPTTMGNYKYINPENIWSASYVTMSMNEPSTNYPNNSYNIYIYDTTGTNATVPVQSMTYTGLTRATSGTLISMQAINGTQTERTFNISSLVKNWIKYERGEGSKSQDYGFVLNGQSSSNYYRHFAAAGNPSVNGGYISITYNVDIEDGIYTIKNFNNNNITGSESPANGIGVNLSESTGETSTTAKTTQRWYIKKISTNTYEITPIDESKNFRLGATGTDTAPKIYTKDTQIQKWEIYENADGSYRFWLRYTSNSFTVLTGNSTSISFNSPGSDYMNPPSNQKWKLTRIDGLAEGIYSIRNYSSNNFLNVPASSPYPSGTTINQTAYSGELSQRWHITKVNDYYEITPQGNYYLRLGVSSVAKTPAAEVLNASETYVKWKLSLNADNSYSIKMTDSLALTQSNGNIVLNTPNTNATTQKWQLIKETPYKMTINNFYDKGFSILYLNAAAKIDGYADETVSRYLQLFGIAVTRNNADLYKSFPDQCPNSKDAEIKQADNFSVGLEFLCNCDIIGKHDMLETHKNDFQTKKRGSTVTTNVIWSGYNLKDANGSTDISDFSLGNSNTVYMNRKVPDSNWRRRLLHEVTHQFRVLDHNKTGAPCVMNGIEDFNSVFSLGILCADCMNNVIANLEIFHKPCFAITTVANVNLFDNADGNMIKTITASGTTIQFLDYEIKNDFLWFKVKCSDGTIGYIKNPPNGSEVLEFTIDTKVRTGNSSLRKFASNTSSSFVTLYKGMDITIKSIVVGELHSVSNDILWFKLEYIDNNGKKYTGYLNSNWVLF